MLWAKRQHGRDWKTTFYDGHIESFQPKGTNTDNGPSKEDLWFLKFPGDDELYAQKWVALKQWLVDKSLTSKAKASGKNKRGASASQAKSAQV